jgi:hypothetical protein
VAHCLHQFFNTDAKEEAWLPEWRASLGGYVIAARFYFGEYTRRNLSSDEEALCHITSAWRQQPPGRSLLASWPLHTATSGQRSEGFTNAMRTNLEELGYIKPSKDVSERFDH